MFLLMVTLNCTTKSLHVKQLIILTCIKEIKLIEYHYKAKKKNKINKRILYLSTENYVLNEINTGTKIWIILSRRLWAIFQIKKYIFFKQIKIHDVIVSVLSSIYFLSVSVWDPVTALRN